jgi:hypothetical protein
MLVFVVALQSPQASKDWPRVSRLWERTLRSICAQTCPDFRVFLVCNERPDIAFTHPSLTIIEEDFPLPEPNTPSRMGDKWLKIKRGLAAAREFAPAHVMIMDADDCVHRDLAALSAESPDAQGWAFEVGYMHDEGSRWLHRLKNFDDYCGTSAIVRLESGDFPRTLSEPIDPYFILTHGHGVIGDFLLDRGTPLARPPFIGAIYITATGENDSRIALRNWRGKKMLLKKLLNARPLTHSIRRDFGLYDLAP